MEEETAPRTQQAAATQVEAGPAARPAEVRRGEVRRSHPRPPSQSCRVRQPRPRRPHPGCAARLVPQVFDSLLAAEGEAESAEAALGCGRGAFRRTKLSPPAASPPAPCLGTPRR